MPKQNSNSTVVRTTVTTNRMNRRHFIYTSALAAGALATSLSPGAAAPNFKSPNEKLDLACIGVGGSRGAQDVAGVSGENIVALCDVDSNMLAQALKKFPNARTYSD